jgi:lipopolysaccharide export system permease protein
MRLLTRYLLRECLVALGYCFGAFLLFFITFDLLDHLQEMQEAKLHVIDIAEHYFFRIPEFLPIALPVALLLASLYALTNHARYNEITAMRAAGISLWRVSLPYFGIGFTLTVLLFVSNELIEPKTSDIADDILTRRVQQAQSREERQLEKNLKFANSRAGRFWQVSIYNKATGEMIQPHIDWRLPDGSWRTIDGDRAIYDTNHVWTFYAVRERKRAAGTNTLEIKLPGADSRSFPEFTESPDMIKSEISVTERLGDKGHTHSADLLIREILDYLELVPNPPKGIRSKIYTKLHGRIAGPCTCLAVIMLAVPFAAGSSRRNVFMGVAASIVIFFIYYLLQQLGFAFGEAGHIPAWFGAWIPNIAVVGASLWLVSRAR